jgi:hypothetical protein
VKTRFMVYEEAIAFNALWALMCLGCCALLSLPS